MHIIIVGCGKVGSTLAEQLQEEDTDLTLIDTDADVINNLTEDIDAMGIVGNGASINTLMEAGVKTADIMIAVTASDELNLLCCLIAQKTGHCQTIARVRNPIYSKEIGFIQERLGLSMIINPEFELDGMSVSQITDKYRCDVLFCAIESKTTLSIPGGDHLVHNGDFISIIATPKNTALFFKKIGLKTHQVKNTLIIGGGTISYYLAKALSDLKISVKIIDKNKERCEELSEMLPNATIICGDGTDRALLMEEGLSTVESFVTLTNMDEENIFLSLSAKNMTQAKLIAKVNRLPYKDVIDELDIGSVIYPKYITSDSILRYVRAMQNTIGSNVETLYHVLDNQAEALEFIIRDNSPVVGIPLSKLNLKNNLLVCCLTREGTVRIPRGQDSIQIGDNVIIVTTHKGLRDIRDILA